MKNSILLILFSVFILSKAQQLNFQVTDSTIKKADIIWIKSYKDGYLVPIDSIVLSQENKDKLQLKLGNYIGYVELGTGNTKNAGIPFIYNYKEIDFSLKISLEDLKLLNYSFNNSQENVLHNLLLKYKSSFDENLNQIRETRKNLNPFDSFYLNKILKLESESDLLYAKMNLVCDSVLKKDKSTFTAVAADFLKSPNGQNNPQLKKYFDNYDALLHYHFFDYIDFSNKLILNYPALTSKINEYFSVYCDNTVESYMDGIDILMKQQKDETVKNFIFNYLLNIFLKKKNEKLVSYLNDKYSDGCGVKLDAEKLKEFSSIVQTQIGAKIPDIISYDNKNEIRSLYNEAEKNKYTLVYIWTSTCHVCQKNIPKVLEIADTYKKNGLGVFAISIDEKKEDWLLAIQKYKTNNWINVAELVSLQKSTVLPKLNIRTTPKLFVVDKGGKIVAKDIPMDDLKMKLEQLLLNK